MDSDSESDSSDEGVEGVDYVLRRIDTYGDGGAYYDQFVSESEEVEEDEGHDGGEGDDEDAEYERIGDDNSGSDNYFSAEEEDELFEQALEQLENES